LGERGAKICRSPLRASTLAPQVNFEDPVAELRAARADFALLNVASPIRPLPAVRQTGPTTRRTLDVTDEEDNFTHERLSSDIATPSEPKRDANYQALPLIATRRAVPAASTSILRCSASKRRLRSHQRQQQRRPKRELHHNLLRIPMSWTEIRSNRHCGYAQAQMERLAFLQSGSKVRLLKKYTTEISQAVLWL
jgi:hypothetical protein